MCSQNREELLPVRRVEVPLDHLPGYWRIRTFFEQYSMQPAQSPADGLPFGTREAPYIHVDSFTDLGNPGQRFQIEDRVMNGYRPAQLLRLGTIGVDRPLDTKLTAHLDEVASGRSVAYEEGDSGDGSVEPGPVIVRLPVFPSPEGMLGNPVQQTPIPLLQTDLIEIAPCF
jgi:hypothetical protein